MYVEEEVGLSYVLLGVRLGLGFILIHIKLK